MKEKNAERKLSVWRNVSVRFTIWISGFESFQKSENFISESNTKSDNEHLSVIKEQSACHCIALLFYLWNAINIHSNHDSIRRKREAEFSRVEHEQEACTSGLVHPLYRLNAA